MHQKFIFITGGVVSSLGKGIAAAALGLLLEGKQLKVAMMKLDPYLNIDPGTMSPYQHGEVYVTDDGSETDLDLGHYYRFTHSPLSRKSNATSGQIYHDVIRRERKGDYLGKTVQVIPHITDEIKQRIMQCAQQEANIDVIIVEIGGTVGDIESQPFLEAIRQFRNENNSHCLNIHVTYVPYLKAASETKTKPTQHSVQMLREIGIMPDLIFCRSEVLLDEDVKEKISLFCSVKKDAVIEVADAEYSIYEVPLKLQQQHADTKVCDLLSIPDKPVDVKCWQELVEKVKNPQGEIKVGIVGKYVQHQDAYKSVFEALKHAAVEKGYLLHILRYESDKLPEDSLPEDMLHCDGYLIPGGFGERGWQGKLLTAQHCRENNIPLFGICLGMQVIVVEFAQNVLHLKKANSTEMDPLTPDPIITLLDNQKNITSRGGTMRLGTYPCVLKSGSKAHLAYGKNLVFERHRHRFELNNFYKNVLQESGLIVSGELQGEKLCEIVEVKDHPWMIGVQFHPEFKSRPTEPHPLFYAFIQAVIDQKKSFRKEI